jgi:hypothetical protein
MVRTTLLGAALSALLLQTAGAQDLTTARNTNVAFDVVAQQAPIQPASDSTLHHPGMANAPGGYAGYGAVGAVIPRLNAPLYPSPLQSTQPWTGGTIVTNQALAPHEMLYPHQYRAMYPPFYYRVRGGWIWTPFGMRQHEQWKLQGTEVRVNYRSHYAPFSGFHPRH